jgi:hypothetical protein
MPNVPAYVGGLTLRMCCALQYLGSKAEEQRHRERLERQTVAEAKLRHLRVRAGCRVARQLAKRVLTHAYLLTSDPAANAHGCSLLSSCARLQQATMDPCQLEHQLQPEQQSTAACKTLQVSCSPLHAAPRQHACLLSLQLINTLEAHCTRLQL